jgi:hypothetical protein
VEDFPEFKGTNVTCPKCGKEMAMLGIEQQGQVRIVYTFACQPCDALDIREIEPRSS